MSDQTRLVYVRWSGQDHKGRVHIGKFSWDLDRVPLALKAIAFFDLWFEPGIQEEIRMRPCDPKEEVSLDQRKVLAAYVKTVGDWARDGKDVVEG